MSILYCLYFIYASVKTFVHSLKKSSGFAFSKLSFNFF
nr:MAG TPA: hypothetical protein [Caudoviricetes sp.]